jgi:AcrR family transcriptional regulator
MGPPPWRAATGRACASTMPIGFDLAHVDDTEVPRFAYHQQTVNDGSAMRSRSAHRAIDTSQMVVAGSKSGGKLLPTTSRQGALVSVETCQDAVIGEPIATDEDQRIVWLSGAARRELLRERMYHAAAELIIQQGIDLFTTDDVAARAGCSRATVYRYVGGKSEIVDAITRRATLSLSQHIGRAVAGLDGPDRVVETILAAVTATRAEPLATQVLLHASDTHIRAHLDSPQVLEAALALAGLHPEDHQAAQALILIVWGLIQHPLDDPSAERILIERFIRPAFDPYDWPATRT